MFNLLKLLRPDHFEGHKNVAKGHEKGKENSLVSLINKLMQNSNIVKLTSDASGGGTATEDDLTVTGLLVADDILSVTQRVVGANSLPLLGWADQKKGSLDFMYSADPGAGAIMEVVVRREVPVK